MKAIKAGIVCILMACVFGGASWAQGVKIHGPMTYQFTLQPGGAAKASFVLTNASDTPEAVKLYQTDYTSSATGQSSYGEPGSNPRSSAGWTVFTPHELTIAPHQSETIYVMVQLPNNDKLVGTYWSMIMVEPLSAGQLTPMKEDPEKLQFAINTKVRYAVRVAVNIGETGRRGLLFTDQRVVNADDRNWLQLDLQNEGERYLKPNVWAELYDGQGVSIGRYEAAIVYGLYPSCSIRYMIPLDKVQGGKYKALVVADNGDEYVYGARYDLEIK